MINEQDPLALLRDMEHARGFAFSVGVTAMYAYLDALPAGIDVHTLTHTIGAGRDSANRVRSFLHTKDCVVAGARRHKLPLIGIALPKLEDAAEAYNRLLYRLATDRLPAMTSRERSAMYLNTIIGAHGLSIAPESTLAVVYAASKKSGQHPESVRQRTIMAVATMHGMEQRLMADVRQYLE